MPFDPSWPWMVKLDRARMHIAELHRVVEEYRTQHVRIEQLPGDGVRRADIILRLSAPIPLAWSGIIGDVLHNLRSALDTFAFELARLHIGDELPQTLVRKPSFPIQKSLDRYESFFAKRRDVFGPAAEQALRSVAPGWLLEGATPSVMADHGVTFESSAIHERVYRLNDLWNIDKHRHLHVTLAWPGMTYWGSNEGENHGWAWGRPPFENGSIIGQLFIGDGAESMPAVVSEIEFRLTEPGCDNEDVVTLLTHWRGGILNWTIPHAWQIHEAASDV
jgi:hypothetical protein